MWKTIYIVSWIFLAYLAKYYYDRSGRKPSVDASVISNYEGFNVVLMGDSTLDNFFWLKDNKLDITQQLNNGYKSNPEINIINLAVDETETIHLLNDNGIKPQQQYIEMRQQLDMNPYPINANTGNVHSFELLKEYTSMSRNANKKTFVILSVGGNDVRITLPLKNITTIIATLKKRHFQDNIDQIIHKLTTEMDDVFVILVMCYAPQQILLDYYGFQEDEFNFLINWAYNIILKMGQKYNLHIIDLLNTFDPYDSSYYSSISPIEPSNKGGQLFVDIIMYVINDLIEAQSDTKVQNSQIYWIPSNSNVVLKKNNDLFQHINLE